MKSKYHRVGFTAAQKAELWEKVKAIVSKANYDFTKQEIIRFCGEASLSKNARHRSTGWRAALAQLTRLSAPR